jgi:positive regulator of sigma E activity
MYIEHPGFVSSLAGGILKISLLESAGCSACHSGLCVLGETSKQVEIQNHHYSFKVGDEVNVRINPTSGIAAVAWLYVVPFFLLVAVLGGMLMAQFNEGWSGLCALSALVPYYTALYLFRKILGKQCKLDVVKR